MIESTLVSMVDRFNSHVEHNPAIRQELKDVERVIELHLTDGDTFQIILKDAQLSLPVKSNGEKPHVRIVTDKATFDGLVKKELGPMKALVTRKLVIEATLEDKILLRRLL